MINSEIYISIGSNTLNKYENVNFGIAQLNRLTYRMIHSKYYITEPEGFTYQPSFLNVVCSITTDLSPFELLYEMDHIERKASRKRVFPNSPRSLDLDILLFGNQIIKTKHLEIPHPRMTTRKFVIEPLAEIAPFLIIPNQNLPVKEILSQLS